MSDNAAPRTSGQISTLQRPLLVCPVQLGDFVLSLPTVRALAEHFNERLGVVADPGTIELLSLVPRKVQSFSFDRTRPGSCANHEPLIGKLGNGFDTVLLLGRHRRLRKLLDKLAFPPSRIAVFDEFGGRAGSHSHLARRFYHFAGAGLGLSIPPFPENPTFSLVNHSRQLLPLDYVVVHPGNSSALRPKGFWRRSKTRHRAWPLLHWVELVELLCRRFSGRVVLTGSAAEMGLADQLVRRLSGPAGRSVDNRAGQTSALELARLLAGAHLYIGVDTGPTHLASILGTPTIALFGPTDPGEVGPLQNGTNLEILRTGIDCSPCIRAVRRRCSSNRCLLDLTPSQVLGGFSQWAPSEAAPQTHEDDEDRKRSVLEN